MSTGKPKVCKTKNIETRNQQQRQAKLEWTGDIVTYEEKAGTFLLSNLSKGVRHDYDPVEM